MVGFLANFRDFKIRFRVDEPDIGEIPPIPPFEWKYTPYGTPKEDIPQDAPTPRGKRIILTHYFDANLMHDILSGKSVTGVIHFWNKTPMDWYSKKQSTAETATYGSEFLTGRTCFEQTIDHRKYIRYLGAPLHDISFAWGDNESMINSSTNPDARLHKRHNILSFHFVRNIIAAQYINLQHLKSEFNISDLVSKHWHYQTVYDTLLKPTFYYEGDTGHLIDSENDTLLDNHCDDIDTIVTIPVTDTQDVIKVNVGELKRNKVQIRKAPFCQSKLELHTVRTP